jgi:hypothetical protein
MFRPESPGSRFGKPNFILGWIASVDSEISIIDLLGVDCRKRREKESKQKRTNPVHKITPAALGGGTPPQCSSTEGVKAVVETVGGAQRT